MTNKKYIVFDQCQIIIIIIQILIVEEFNRKMYNLLVNINYTIQHILCVYPVFFIHAIVLLHKVSQLLYEYLLYKIKYEYMLYKVNNQL